MLRFFLVWTILTIAVSTLAGNINLVKNGDFLKLNQNKLPQNWRCINSNTKTTFKIVKNAIDKKNTVCINLSSFKDRAWLKQSLHKYLPQGTLFKISCNYRTENYQPNRYDALYLQLTYSGHIKGSPSNRLYLSATPEWKYVEKTFISCEKFNPAISLLASRSKGKVFVSDIKVEIITQSSTANNTNQYFWREAEDCFKARRATVSKWKSEKIKYSGKGATGCSDCTLKWKCFIKEIIDQKSLLPKSMAYHLWIRVYGHIERPKITVWWCGKTGQRRRISTYQTVSNEQKDAKGKYAGPGKFYWQYVGSFATKGGITEFEIIPKGRFFADAILLTDDISCRPLEFELRESGIKNTSSFKTIKNEEKVFIDSSYTLFGITDKFATPLNFKIFPQKGFRCSRTIKNPAYVYFALPNWVEVRGITSHWAGQTYKTGASAGFLKLTKVKEQKFDGITYNVYRTPVYYLYSWICLFIKGKVATTPFGKRQNVYFWLQDGKLKTSARKMLIEAVDLNGPVKQFKNVFIGPMENHLRNFFRDYPKLPENLKYCGFNMVNSWGGEGLARANQAEVTKTFIKACNRLNISVIDELSPGYKYWKVKPVRAINDKGKKDHALALYLDQASPYMQYMQQGIDNIVKGGASGLTMDDEVFNHAYDTIDFSPQTKELFKRYLLKKHSELKYIDPLEIVKNKRQLKKLYQTWIDFRCSRVTSWYKLYSEAYDKALKQYGSNSTFGKKYLIPVIVNGNNYEQYKRRVCFDLKQVAKYVTHISPMIYTYYGIKRTGTVGESIKLFWKFTGLKKNIITPTLLGGHRGFGEIPYSQMKMVKYEIYECLINQSPGMFFWITSGTMNPLVLKQIMTALKTSVPYENFFRKGIPVDVKISPKALKADALKLNNKLIIYVSNYKLSEKFVATVELPEGNIKKIIDLETDTLLNYSNNKFKVDFNKERGRMFLVKYTH